MAYAVQKLKWVREAPELDDVKQKVLLALSDDRYEWRTKRGLLATTGLSAEQLEGALADLIREDFVRPSLSRARELIYGLKERVGAQA